MKVEDGELADDKPGGEFADDEPEAADQPFPNCTVIYKCFASKILLSCVQASHASQQRDKLPATWVSDAQLWDLSNQALYHWLCDP